jgi:hypothetical protein
VPGPRHAAVVLAAAVLLVGAPPALAAPALTTDLPCYSVYTPLRLSGTGFTPGGQVRLVETWIDPDATRRAGETLSATADAGGVFHYAQELPRVAIAQFHLEVVATDVATQQTAATTAGVSFFGAFFPPWNTMGPATARPGRRARLEVGGYIGSNSDVLYLHYIRHDRAVKTVRIGRLAAPCGTLTTRLREFDFRPLARGTYRAVFDTTRAWPNDDMWSGYMRVVVASRRTPKDPLRRSIGSLRAP